MGIPAFGLKLLTNIPSHRGLGALVAQKFAAEGSNVAINYMSNKASADNTASEIASKYNVKTIVVQGVCFHHATVSKKISSLLHIKAEY